jgi:hypothetical protein
LLFKPVHAQSVGVRFSLKQKRNLISIWLAFALILPVESLPGQQPLPSQPVPTALNIVVIEGEGAINNIKQRTAHDPIIRVEDENHKPIAGAAVVFTLPTEGATGEFGNGSKNLTVMTDSQGAAKAQGLKVSQVNGKLPIHVTASYRGLTARTTIMQFIEGAPPGATVAKHGGSGKIIAVLAVIGAAAAGGGAYAATRKSGSTTVTPPPSGPAAIGITPGAGTISPPH